MRCGRQGQGRGGGTDLKHALGLDPGVNVLRVAAGAAARQAQAVPVEGRRAVEESKCCRRALRHTLLRVEA